MSFWTSPFVQKRKLDETPVTCGDFMGKTGLYARTLENRICHHRVTNRLLPLMEKVVRKGNMRGKEGLPEVSPKPRYIWRSSGGRQAVGVAPQPHRSPRRSWSTGVEEWCVWKERQENKPPDRACKPCRRARRCVCLQSLHWRLSARVPCSSVLPSSLPAAPLLEGGREAGG